MSQSGPISLLGSSGQAGDSANIPRLSSVYGSGINQPAGVLAVGPVRQDNINAASLADIVINGYRTVSAANTQVQTVLDIRNLLTVLLIVATGTGGTFTLAVDGSVDNVNFVSIDSIVAAASQIKQYLSSTVGAVTAVTPLGFRFVRITTGAAGVGFTTTTTVSCK